MKFYMKRRRAPMINIVSLIDILTILLIFFVVTTTFKKAQPQVAIELPSAKTAASTPSESDPAVITVSSKEEIYLDEKQIELEALGATIKQIQEQTPSRPIALNADKKASFGFIISILDALKKAGVKNLPAFTHDPTAPK